METKQLITADDLMKIEGHCELVEGELVEMSPAGGVHGFIVHKIGWIIGEFIEDEGLGTAFGAEIGFKLKNDPDTVRAADFSYVSKDRLKSLPKGYPELAPDLVAEVVSPEDRASELQRKVAQYLEAGSKAVLVFYPDTKTIMVHRSPSDVRAFGENDELTIEDVLPGFKCGVGKFFEA